jgi:2-oxoglutarate ferredoxin oxidoreductase subunit alpha
MSQSASPVINDMSLQVATVNGSGSQSANMVLLRTLFQMGVPVSGKNLFPSNIAGLPTWYTIRASKDGWIARKKEIDLLVAMNAETAQEDTLSLRPGSAVVLRRAAEALRGALRSRLLPGAFDKVIQPVTNDAKVKKLLKNMAYVGVVAQLLGPGDAGGGSSHRQAVPQEGQGGRAERQGARAGQEYAKASLQKHDPFEIRRMDANRGKIIIEGNAAGASARCSAGSRW